MPQIRFTRDYRGKLTGERFYEAGAVADLDTAAGIVAEGAAEWVPEPEPEKPKAKPKAKRRRSSK